jgi:NAD(P)-dependent dehydrogenase (short-subunit alcohol dehydrogenase family)
VCAPPHHHACGFAALQGVARSTLTGAAGFVGPVWVTGASQGLGEALVMALAAQGAKLVLSARREAALEAVAAKCPHRGNVVVLPLDVTGSADTLQAAVTKAQAAFDGQGVDILVRGPALLCVKAHGAVCHRPRD